MAKENNTIFNLTIAGMVLFLIGFNVHAQPPCKVEHYSTEQGLSHQSVTCMLKDREGFMWFGTWDGINRFDGRTFVSYKSSPGDQSQLANGRIDQMVEDQADHLWIEAYDRQIYRFDKKNGQFLALSAIINPGGKQKITFSKILLASNGWVWLQSVNEGLFCVSQTNLSPHHVTRYKKALAREYQLPSNTINFFHEDREKRIWIGTPEGLCCLVLSASGIYKNSKIASLNIAEGKNFTVFDEDADLLYFGTADGNLFTYEKRSGLFSVHKMVSGHLNGLLRSKKSDCIYATTLNGEVITYHLKDGKITTASYRPGEPFSSIYEDKKGCLWIAPSKEGIVRFDPSTRSFSYFSQKSTDRFNIISNRVVIWEDNSNLIWVYMKGGGFGYYNAATDAFDNILFTPDAGINRLPNTLYSLYYDQAGILWLTTNERQLIKIILQGNDFRQQLLAEPGLSKWDNEVRGICSDRKNRLWLGAKSGKVYVYQDDKRLTGLFDNEPVEGMGLVYSIMQDSRGNIWMGTKGNGLFKASPVNREETKYHLTHFRPDKNDPNSLPCNQIYALLEDTRGRIWIGSFDKGLFFVQEEGDSTKFLPAGHVAKNYPNEVFNKVRHMALDSAGNLWIGTTNGLLLLHAGSRHTTGNYYASYRKVPGDLNSLGNNDIQFIYRDMKNRMWLSTSGGGFCHAIGDQPFVSLQFRNYTTKEGMPNNYVLSCAEDASGNLWIATENGLSKFNADNQLFRNYDSYDGLPRAGFSEAAVCKRFIDGRLVFGTTKGFLSFDPARISKKRIAANIVFTGLQINNEDMGPGMNDTALKKNINYVTDLTLKYNQNIISIDYAILDHRAGNRQAFAYRLSGFDSTWHDDRQQRRITYTNLPPGNYVFEVKSLSHDLYSNAPYRRLAITILPPPWKTWWAYLLYVLGIGLLLAFVRRTALAMIRLRNKIAIEQKLAALKLNFFTNVSHELRTPLTLIVNPLEQLAKKEKLSPEGAGLVEVARKNASRMVRFINQLLDLRKVESNKATLHVSRIEIVNFVKKISAHFSEAAKSKSIELCIAEEYTELVVWADAEKLDVVIYNLLANALKFTPEGKMIRILIRPLPEEQHFIIAVHDQGPGVEEKKLNDIFELFYEGDHPGGRSMKGTGIGLALSRELVNLHGGSIRATNNEDGGLTVTIKMKLGFDHFKKEEVSFVEMPKTIAVCEETAPHQLPHQSLTTAALPGHSPQAPLVLLVEDNDELRIFLKGQLTEFYQVATARNGEEGWQKALHLMPDLIVSDIMMPVMDGIQMLDKLKNDIHTSHIPVVLLSAKYSIESQIEGLKYGADYYITKPFHNEFLIASIDNLIRQRKNLFDSLVNKQQPIPLSPAPIVVTSRDETFLKEVIRIVEDKMTDHDFNIDTVAGNMNMSRTAFYKKFKSLTDLTPVEFVRDMRLQRAKQYLDTGSTNISEVSYWSGFNNPKYFSTCFREKYDVSPSDYMKANKV